MSEYIVGRAAFGPSTDCATPVKHSFSYVSAGNTPEQNLREANTALRDRIAALEAENAKLKEAIQAAIDCGMVPVTSASEGGASRYSRQVVVADMLRAALT